MPSSRRIKVTGLAVLLVFCVIYYITNGASSTTNSPFYQRTLQALQDKENAQARADVIAEEQQRLKRVEQLQKEHDAAVAKEVPTAATQKQQPIVPDAAGDSASSSGGEKSVAGRKMMKGDKIVYERPDKDEDDGVAKVGNVEPKSSLAAVSDDETEEEHRTEAALNEILRKGPIIIFSKTYCPYSKKAKHILLDLYSISPPPFVVELDEHELGPGLQAKLEKTTGRRTVPNVLINGKSIGGGDDVQELHDEDKLIEKVKTMGGKRIIIEKKDDGYSDIRTPEEMRKFKA